MSEELTKEEEKKYDEFNNELLNYFSDNFLNEYIAYYLYLSHKYDLIGNTSFDTMIYTGICEIANTEKLRPDTKIVLNVLENNYHLKLIEKTHCKFEELCYNESRQTKKSIEIGSLRISKIFQKRRAK